MKIFLKKERVFLLSILLLGLFIRLFRMNELMVFFGDSARDYLAARDMTLKGIIPLLGSPSSVPWLHQGALFTYILGIVLWVAKYNPLWGGYFTGVLGVLSIYLVYRLGKAFFNQKVGLTAALFYTTSPLVVIFDRNPYHQSLISILVVLFFLALNKSVKSSRYFIYSSFVLGLLLQTELSNLVLLPILIILFLDYRKNISFQQLVCSLSAFLIPWIPKLVYDVSSGFTQTLGFVAWAIHKVLPIGPLADQAGAGIPITSRLYILLEYFSRIIYWPNLVVSSGVLVLFFIFILRNLKLSKRKQKPGYYLLFLWLIVPIIGFLIHGSPAGGYVPVFFALVAVLSGSLLGNISGSYKIPSYLLFTALVFYNGLFLLNNDYFVLNGHETRWKDKFNMGQGVSLVREMAEYLIADSNESPYSIYPLGSYAQFPSQKLDLVYLTWYLGKEPNAEGKGITYYVYGNQDNLFLENNYVKNEFLYMTIARKPND